MDNEVVVRRMVVFGERFGFHSLLEVLKIVALSWVNLEEAQAVRSELQELHNLCPHDREPTWNQINALFAKECALRNQHEREQLSASEDGAAEPKRTRLWYAQDNRDGLWFGWQYHRCEVMCHQMFPRQPWSMVIIATSDMVDTIFSVMDGMDNPPDRTCTTASQDDLPWFMHDR